MNLKIFFSIILLSASLPVFGMHSDTIVGYSYIADDYVIEQDFSFTNPIDWCVDTIGAVIDRSTKKVLDHCISEAIGIKQQSTIDNIDSIAEKGVAKALRKQLDKPVVKAADYAAEQLVRSVTGWHLYDEVPKLASPQDTALELTLLNAQLKKAHHTSDENNENKEENMVSTYAE